MLPCLTFADDIAFTAKPAILLYYLAIASFLPTSGKYMGFKGPYLLFGGISCG